MSSIIRGTDNVDSAVIVETNGLAVTDNAIVRYDGTTGKVQNSSVTIDDVGNLLLTSGTGALGYGTGAGGTVTQLTSKSTPVTIDKPTGAIVTASDTLAAGATASFIVNNSLYTPSDTLILVNMFNTAIYNVYWGEPIGNGQFNVYITNKGVASATHSLTLRFSIIKGATI